MSAARGGIDPRVIVALDFADAKSALGLAERLDPATCRLKVGSELYTAAGPEFVKQLVARKFPVFLDLKFHDIPNTVAAACRAAAALGVWMMNVHAAGGKAMMAAAREALPPGTHTPLLIAVTVLTSLNELELREVGFVESAQEAALRLARLAQSCGLDGVVCSAQEAAILRRALGADFVLVTPGIRPGQTSHDDQQRVTTPRAAIQNGASYLVIGRPITRAPDPLAALSEINAQISAGGSAK